MDGGRSGAGDAGGGLPLLPGEEVRWVGGFSGQVAGPAPIDAPGAGPGPSAMGGAFGFAGADFSPPAPQRRSTSRPWGTAVGEGAGQVATKLLLGVFLFFVAFPLFIGLTSPIFGPDFLFGGFPFFFGGFPVIFLIAMVVVFSVLQRSRRPSGRSIWGTERTSRRWTPGQRWAPPPLPAPVAWGRPGTYVVTNQRVLTIEPSGLESSLPLGEVVPTVLRRTTTTSAVSFATRNPTSPPLVFESQPIAEIDRIMAALRPPSAPPPSPPSSDPQPWTDPFDLPAQSPVVPPPASPPTEALGPYHWTPPGSDPPTP